MSRSHKQEWIILIGLAAAVLTILTVMGVSGLLREDDPFERLKERTSYSARAEGLLACYTLYEELGHKVERYDGPVYEDALSGAGVLFLISPTIAPSGPEVDELEAWIRQGGVLVCSVSDSNASGMWFGALGLPELTDERQDVSGLKVVADSFPDVSTVSFNSRHVFQNTDDRRLTVLYADDAGARIVSKPFGSGLVICLADDSFLSNHGLRAPDNAILAERLIEMAQSRSNRDGSVFLERHLGIPGSSGRSTLVAHMLLRTEPGWSVLSLAAGGLVFLVYKSRRFGARRKPGRPPRRSRMEYVNSVASTCRQAGVHSLMFRINYQWERRRLCERFRLPASASSKDIIFAADREMAPGKSDGLKECEAALQKPKLSADRASALIRTLGRIESEVLNGNSGK